MTNDVIGLGDFKGTPIEKAVEEQKFTPYDQKTFDEYMDSWRTGKQLGKDGKKIDQEQALKNAFEIAKTK